MDYYGMTDRAILVELGSRLRRRRLNRNITQQRLADEAGVSRLNIYHLESGRGIHLMSFVRVLRTLESLAELDAFLPERGISPLQLAKLKGTPRRRASRKRATQ